MQTSPWEPDIVVGIDFGMTYTGTCVPCNRFINLVPSKWSQTGVAWSQGPDWPESQSFVLWPGTSIDSQAFKVPTVLQYTRNSTLPKAWGFLCDQDSGDPGLREYFNFKLHLDPLFKEDVRPDRPTTQQARQYYVDYLRAIHDHIAGKFSDIISEWRTQRVEFVFSVPTTWKNPGMIAEMERLLKSAGYENKARNHRAKIGLTEAEAAAVYAAKQQYGKGDVLLICDAGGGTTDVNVLKVMSANPQSISLRPLSWVEGRPLGSTNLDRAVHKLIVNRLSHIQHQLHDDPAIVADMMMRLDARFEQFKCSYGLSDVDAQRILPLPVPRLPEGFYHRDAMIENSSMILSWFDAPAK